MEHISIMMFFMCKNGILLIMTKNYIYQGAERMLRNSILFEIYYMPFIINLYIYIYDVYISMYI